MTLKELKDLIKLCRATGVTDLKMGDVEIKLGTEPLLKNKQVTKSRQNVTYSPGGITEDTLIVTDGLTQEDLLYYSSGSVEETA